MQRSTISDVAKRAGVSKATVSHVVNNTRFVTEETKQNVLKAIKDLHYSPSQIARSLNIQRTLTAGMLISDISNPFYPQILLGAEKVALEHDYNLFLFNAGNDTQRSIKYIRSMVERRVDGLILMSSHTSLEMVHAALDYGLSTVILDWNGLDVPGTGVISFHFEIGIRQAVAHLIDQGHRHFAHVAGNLEMPTARIRCELFINILGEYGIAPSEVSVVENCFEIDGGRRALHILMKTNPRPTAIFAVHDLTALGLMFESKRLGLTVPDDFSVVGLDDITFASQMSPSLTTVSLPGNVIGQKAMSMLLQLIDQNDSQAERLYEVIPTDFIIRESTTSPQNLRER